MKDICIPRYAIRGHASTLDASGGRQRAAAQRAAR